MKMESLLEHVRPLISNQEVCVAASNIFGLESVEVVSELESYEDRNFHIRAYRAVRNNNEKEDFVFKVLRSKSTYLTAFENMKTEYMRILYDKCEGIAIQEIIPTLTGELNGKVLLELPANIVKANGRSKLIQSGADFLVIDKEDKLWFTHLTRLVTFIEGRSISASTIDRGMLVDAGRIAACFQKASKNVEVSNVSYCENDLWDLRNLNLCKKLYLPKLVDKHHKSMMMSAIDQIEAIAMPNLNQLPRQYIHGDLNEGNILVSYSSDSTKAQYGVIDFGESGYTCRVFEMAVLIAYMLLESDIQKTGLSHIDVATAIMEGFINADGFISTEELNVLYYLILGRLCQSLLIGNYLMNEVDTGNKYITNTSRNGWQVMQDLLELKDEPFLRAWNNCI